MEVGGALTIETRNVTLTQPPKRLEEPEPGDYVAISVCDTGAGMSEEVLAKAFEPFFTTKPVGKGSGLGLAQVFGFAKQSGGGVSIQSRAGEGTCVRVYLPRTADAADAVSRRLPTAPVSEPNGRTLLLVDDDDAVREVEAETLRQLGYEVIQAASGDEALRLLDAHPAIDGMVADFAMPGMNGVDLARHAQTARPGLPVLFLTGYGDLDALAGAGEARVAPKPFRTEELAAKLDALLRQDPPSDR